MQALGCSWYADEYQQPLWGTANLSEALLFQHALQLRNDDVLCSDVETAALLVVACPPIDTARLIEGRYCPAQSHNAF